MKMSSADVAAYPKTAKYVRDGIQSLVRVPSIIGAMQTIGQLNRPRFEHALRWGNNPSIRVTTLSGAHGEFTPGVGSNEIRISTLLATSFESGHDLRPARAGNVHLLGVTLLHELVHWGDDQDGVDRPGEEGEEFEIAIYGSVIN
jgi:hypothetical protein